MKNVVVIFGKTLDHPRQPFSRPHYQAAYEEFYTLAEKEGLKMYRASLSWFNHAKGTFDSAWTFDSAKGWHEVSDIKPDLLEDRARQTEENHAEKVLLARQFPIINDPAFTIIANSKYETSVLLPEYFKAYTRIADKIELEKNLRALEEKLVVAKPEFGSGGKGVVIDTGKNLLQTDLSYPLIIQEFIDSSHGIPGITPGYHDLRLVFINDSLIYNYIRVPKEGSLLANVAQGGQMYIVEEKDLPASLTPVIAAVQKVFARFPRKIYTIDLIFDENAQPWIVELNTMPGVYFAPGQEKTRDIFYRALIEELRASLGSV